MYNLIYSKSAQDDLKKIDNKSVSRILDKMVWYSKREDILKFSKPLAGYRDKYYRIRIGKYRIIYRIDKKEDLKIFIVLRIKGRNAIYKITILE